MSETLASYRARTRRLLHDASGAYFSDADLTVDINDAIAERDRWSGGSRSYQANKLLTVGVDQYSLKALFGTPQLGATILSDSFASTVSGWAATLGSVGTVSWDSGNGGQLKLAPGLGSVTATKDVVVTPLTSYSFKITVRTTPTLVTITSAGTVIYSQTLPPGSYTATIKTLDATLVTITALQSTGDSFLDDIQLIQYLATFVVLDVINLILVYGATRVTLQNPPFTDLTTMGRSNTQFQNRPWGWARYGADTVYIVPKPATAYPTDWDLVTLSGTLALETDADALDFPYTVPVPYYAAYLAKINQRQFQEADTFLGYFQKAIRDIDSARVGEMVSAYDKRGGRV